MDNVVILYQLTATGKRFTMQMITFVLNAMTLSEFLESSIVTTSCTIRHKQKPSHMSEQPFSMEQISRWSHWFKLEIDLNKAPVRRMGLLEVGDGWQTMSNTIHELWAKASEKLNHSNQTHLYPWLYSF